MENKDIKIKEEKVNDAQPQVVEVTPVAHAETDKGFMPRKTFILISLLVLITACLLVLALIPNFKNSTTPTKPKPIANIDYAQTKLSLSNPTALSTTNYETNVLISTGKNKVTVAQLEFVYDPKILGNVNIKPGAFFTNSVVLLKKIDQINGRITYVLGINPGDTPSTGDGTVATISFSNIASQAAVSTPINFLPKTAVNAVGYAQSVLLKATGVLFSVSPTPTITK
jgi:ABC-type oligopeptide transport system substrate-binding subunit